MNEPVEEHGPVDAATRDECVRWSRYLLDRDPPPGACERYARAVSLRLPEPPSVFDDRVLRFVTSRPGSLPFVDAALGLLRPRAALRRRLLLLLAVLESSPQLWPVFSEPPRGRVRALFGLAGRGLAAGFRAGVGLVLYALFLRERR